MALIVKANGNVVIDDNVNLMLKEFRKDNVTVGANTGKAFDVNTPVPSGYIEIGTIDTRSNAYDLIPVNYSGTTTTSVNVRNIATSQKTGAITVTKLYRKIP